MSTSSSHTQFDKAYFSGASYEDYLVEHEKIAEEDIVGPLISLIHPEPTWTFLDVGCAMGGAISAFQKRGFVCKGVDVSEFCLTNSLVKEHMQFAMSDALPFEDKSYDVVFCSDVFQYLTLKQAERSAAEFVRVAGRFVALWVFAGSDSDGWSQEINADEFRKEDTRKLGKDDYIEMFERHGASLHSFVDWKPKEDEEYFTPLWNFVFSV